MAVSMGAVIALIKALGADPAVIEQAVSDWLDDHPEATTTVEDGSITYAKLASALAAAVDSIADKYEKPSGGIPGTDLASGVIPDISGKQDAPSTTGTAGQVLGLDSNLAPVWTDKGGGGSGGAVDDVQVNGVSVVTDGVANVPIASNSVVGVVKGTTTLGIQVNNSNGNAFLDSTHHSHYNFNQQMLTKQPTIKLRREMMNIMPLYQIIRISLYFMVCPNLPGKTSRMTP